MANSSDNRFANFTEQVKAEELMREKAEREKEEEERRARLAKPKERYSPELLKKYHNDMLRAATIFAPAVKDSSFEEALNLLNDAVTYYADGTSYTWDRVMDKINFAKDTKAKERPPVKPQAQSVKPVKPANPVKPQEKSVKPQATEVMDIDEVEASDQEASGTEGSDKEYEEQTGSERSSSAQPETPSPNPPQQTPKSMKKMIADIVETVDTANTTGKKEKPPSSGVKTRSKSRDEA